MKKKKVLTEKEASLEQAARLEEFASEVLKYEEDVEAGKKETNLYIKAFPVSLSDRLKQEAKKRHLSYSSYIKMVLQGHIDSLDKIG